MTTNDDAASSTSTSASPSPSLSSISPISQTTNGSDTPTVDNVDSNLSNSDYLAEEEITIKIKYLNDSMKTVKARPSEPIGDFKKYVLNSVKLHFVFHCKLAFRFHLPKIGEPLMKN